MSNIFETFCKTTKENYKQQVYCTAKSACCQARLHKEITGCWSTVFTRCEVCKDEQ